MMASGKINASESNVIKDYIKIQMDKRGFLQIIIK